MELQIKQRNIGATFDRGKGALVKVWAPGKSCVGIEVPQKGWKKSLRPVERGFWELQTEELFPGDLYRFLIDDKKSCPDPASLSQPDGVHGLSEAVDTSSFEWNDAGWENPLFSDYIIYELHTGTFTGEGTFSALTEKLPYLRSLGITAVEVMPVAQFPGSRNWGYDGVFPFAVQHSYGGYKTLQQFVNACHQQGIAVILDVVYNHLGPEGNCLEAFGPCFTDKYKTPWGQAVNFDDSGCDGVRNYYLENALMWLRDFHIDALRLDAVHAIKDLGAKHFLAELSEKVSELEKQTGSTYYLIAESDLNDPKYIRCREKYGYGMDAQWIDEFHHALRVTSGEKPRGYYADFDGISHLAKAYRDAYVYDGIFSVHRNRTFGARAEDMPGEKFVVFSQNHDQVGNRMRGERTSHLTSFEMQKLLAGAVLLSPYIPMLFMGEEWSAPTPFLYFVSHSDPKLIKAVREGRKEEFRDFHSQGKVPDPQSEQTFFDSQLPWDKLDEEPHRTMLEYYKALTDMRKKYRFLLSRDSSGFKEWHNKGNKTLCLQYEKDKNRLICCMNFSKAVREVSLPTGTPVIKNVFNSADPAWRGKHNMPFHIKNNQGVKTPPESITVYSNTYV